VQRVAGAGRIWAGRLPPTLEPDQPGSGATLQKVQKGGVYRGLYDGGFQSRPCEGAVPGVNTGRADGSTADAVAGAAGAIAGVASAGEALGRAVPGTDSPVPGPADQRPPGETAQATAEAVMPGTRRLWPALAW